MLEAKKGWSKYFCDQIITEAVKQGKSIDDLGLTDLTLGDLISGRKELTADIVIALCDELKIDTAEFIAGWKAKCFRPQSKAPSKETLATMLNIEMERQDLTLGKLAHMAQMNMYTLGAYVTGKRFPNIRCYKKLCKALGVDDIDWYCKLKDGDDE